MVAHSKQLTTMPAVAKGEVAVAQERGRPEVSDRSRTGVLARVSIRTPPLDLPLDEGQVIKNRLLSNPCLCDATFKFPHTHAHAHPISLPRFLQIHTPHLLRQTRPGRAIAATLSSPPVVISTSPILVTPSQASGLYTTENDEETSADTPV